MYLNLVNRQGYQTFIWSPNSLSILQCNAIRFELTGQHIWGSSANKKNRSHCPQWECKCTWFILDWAIFLKLCSSCEAEQETILIIQSFLKIPYPHFSLLVAATNKEWPLDLFHLFFCFRGAHCIWHLRLSGKTAVERPQHSTQHDRNLCSQTFIKSHLHPALFLTGRLKSKLDLTRWAN